MNFFPLRILIDGKGCFIDLTEKKCLVSDFKIKMLSRYPSLIPNNYMVLILRGLNLPFVPLGTDQIGKYCIPNSLVLIILQQSYFRSYKKNPTITHLRLPRSKLPKTENEKLKIHIQSVSIEPYKKQNSKFFTANDKFSGNKFKGFFIISPYSLPPEPIIKYNRKFHFLVKLTTKYHSSCKVTYKEFENINNWMTVLIIQILKKRKIFQSYSAVPIEKTKLKEEKLITDDSPNKIKKDEIQNAPITHTTTQKFSNNIISQTIKSAIEKVEIKHEKWDPFYFLPWFVPTKTNLSNQLDPLQYSLKMLKENLNGNLLSKELKEFAKREN